MWLLWRFDVRVIGFMSSGFMFERGSGVQDLFLFLSPIWPPPGPHSPIRFLLFYRILFTSFLNSCRLVSRSIFRFVFRFIFRFVPFRVSCLVSCFVPFRFVSFVYSSFRFSIVFLLRFSFVSSLFWFVLFRFVSYRFSLCSPFRTVSSAVVVLFPFVSYRFALCFPFRIVSSAVGLFRSVSISFHSVPLPLDRRSVSDPAPSNLSIMTFPLNASVIGSIGASSSRANRDSLRQPRRS